MQHPQGTEAALTAVSQTSATARSGVSTNVSGEAELSQPARTGWAPFLPLALLTCAVLVWTAFQSLQLYREWGNLQTLRTNQETQVQASARLRTALDTLARDMAKLAEQGNPNARTVVEELRKRGITINPNAPPAK